MIFKRRDKRPMLQIMQEAVYPRRGWARAFNYMGHRLRRLPDTPQKIARGVFAGIFMCFTPFFGLHIVFALLLCIPMRANVVAAVLATFFGNPVTFPIIALSSLTVGHWFLGETYASEGPRSVMHGFRGASADLKDNFVAMFTDSKTDWTRLGQFFHDVYLPYIVGGFVLGIFASLIAYYLTVPLISAYQKRRKGRLHKKLSELRAAAGKKKADDRPPER
ncbi:MAG: DUF2062 domain-containing protein [Pseudoruegeria sp.]